MIETLQSISITLTGGFAILGIVLMAYGVWHGVIEPIRTWIREFKQALTDGW